MLLLQARVHLAPRRTSFLLRFLSLLPRIRLRRPPARARSGVGAQFCLFEAEDDTLMNFTDQGALYATNETFGKINKIRKMSQKRTGEGRRSVSTGAQAERRRFQTPENDLKKSTIVPSRQLQRY